MRALTTTDVAHRPYPGTTTPTSVGFSPDGRFVTLLLAEPGSLRQQLHAVDVATGVSRVVSAPGAEVDEASLSIEEKLRRERARELAVGITRYAWATRADRMLVPMADGVWVFDGLDAEPRRVVATGDVPGPVLDAAISDDGRLVGFVADDEVYVVDVDPATGGGADPVQVTTGARGTGRTNGLAEYIAQEEMGRGRGFWLAPDGAHVAFCEVDETHIPVYRIVHQGSDDVGPGAQEDHRYPFAGAENAHVRVGVVPTRPGGAVRWLDLDASGIGADRYVARVDWWGDDAVVVQLENRAQDRLDLVRFGPIAGDGPLEATTLLSERSDVWINLHDHWRPLPDGGFLWASERSGHCHLEVRDADGSPRHALTAGDWQVTQVHAVDADQVWFTATIESPLDRSLCRVPLDGSAPPEVVAGGAAIHTSVVHGPSGARVMTNSAPDAPPVTVLVAGDGTEHLLHDGATDPAVGELALRPPELRTVIADDGTELHAAVYEPDGAGPHPTVLWVYGGPHAQLVTRSWTPTVAMRAQYLRQEGFRVAVLDNRGMAARGLAFEGALKHRMGTIEVDDQVRLVEALVADGGTDPARVGVYGWSYGGYLSLCCLARRPDVFAAACAGAPVTDWDGYDTHYTERYMGTPAGNPAGYADGAVATHVEGLRDRDLLIVHGLIDENVHFRHTARLLNALHRAGIEHELLLYPDERHVPRHEADRRSMEDLITRFVVRSLGRA